MQLVVHVNGTSRVQPLPERGVVSIGRGDGNTVRIEDASVSRQHAILLIGEDTIHVQDLGSAQGTFRVPPDASAGGRDVRLAPHERLKLAPGDSLRIGAARLVVELASQAVTSPPSVAEDAPEVLRDPTMLELRAFATRVAATGLSVLILGESGTGKERTAQHIHHESQRAAGPFTALDCAALTETLVESALFGHERGAFTGADTARVGLLEASHGGTLFLDEIAELSLRTQAKLLRVLEERAITRVGATEPHRVDVRFVSATHRSLRRLVRQGAFRSDLYYRIAGVVLTIPPLRERPRDIEPLASYFLRTFCARLGRPQPILTQAAIDVLQIYRWPGNARELRNVMERAALLAEGSLVEARHIQLGGSISLERPRSAKPLPRGSELPGEERARIVRALELCGGNQTRASRMLGMSRGTLASRIDQLGLKRPKKS